ncbi:MAG: glycoside hydrolase family 1 protein [bacterium]|nr:glycoside hydrolase family 1 protein [bacterium]
MKKFGRKQRKRIKKETGHSHEPLAFPKKFLWGTSTSAYQVEGGIFNNDWANWEQKKDTIENGEKCGQAADHYNRYEEDFDIAKGLHNNAHRLSIEWSRIEPKEGEWNWEEVDHYRNVLKELHNRKIKVVLTLHHFTNPVWLEKKGGWLHKSAPAHFARYAEFIAEHLGNHVDMWITINEPVVYATQSYLTGEWPPQSRNKLHAFKVLRHMAQGHQLAYHEIHAEMKKQHRTAVVGVAKNVVSLASYSRAIISFFYIRISEFLWNDLFFLLIKNKTDFIGINYYFHTRIRRDNKGKFMFVDVKTEQREHSDLGWEVYAPGLFNVLLNLQKYGKPMYVTENGIATTNDDKRSRYIVAHLKELYHAIQAGADVRGYFHWSLIDNFEWHRGFKPRFGLVEIDYKTFERKIRSSAHVYARICKENAIDHDLLSFLGHGSRYEDL